LPLPHLIGHALRELRDIDSYFLEIDLDDAAITINHAPIERRRAGIDV
jgi:hypothetical protein